MRRIRARFAPFLLVVLLLGAQYGALTHAAWHAAHAHDLAHEHTHDRAHDGGDAHEGDFPASHHAELCAFDLAFSQVLGGVHTCAEFTSPVAGGAITALDIPASRLKAEALAPKSRGPPFVLL